MFFLSLKLLLFFCYIFGLIMNFFLFCCSISSCMMECIIMFLIFVVVFIVSIALVCFIIQSPQEEYNDFMQHHRLQFRCYVIYVRIIYILLWLKTDSLCIYNEFSKNNRKIKIETKTKKKKL